jgi:hypothetical protein
LETSNQATNCRNNIQHNRTIAKASSWSGRIKANLSHATIKALYTHAFVNGDNMPTVHLSVLFKAPTRRAQQTDEDDNLDTIQKFRYFPNANFGHNGKMEYLYRSSHIDIVKSLD